MEGGRERVREEEVRRLGEREKERGRREGEREREGGIGK